MAAAYGALVSLMNDLELIPNHLLHSFSFHSNQTTSLSQTVIFLIDFMETCDSRGSSRGATQVLENRIASAAHAAHDVIETHAVNQIQAGQTLGGKASCRSSFLLDLQKAIDHMNFVKREAMQFQARISGFKEEEPLHSAPTSSENLTSGKNSMVGFDAVALRLTEMLTGEPSGRRVIPIVGMGGIGKTTLARNVHENLLIQQHFDVHIWATISQDYCIETVVRELLLRERSSSMGENVNELGEQLHKKLWGRRYLIVLDDMWSAEAWNQIGMFLPDNGNGSCVIVTTRLSSLGAHLSSSPVEMNFLDKDRSWELFCGNAFGEEEDCPIELEGIGKNIVKRCRGLPLSIVVIGGHLRRSSRSIEYWEKVANFMNPISSVGEDEQCLEIVNLSYEHLPPCLKPCFLYMGIFGEDERINASKLPRIWVAEGFVRAKEGQTLEEVAEDYLNDLIDRNLILVRERKWNGKAKTCVIHDILRELCLKVAEREKFFGVLGTKNAMDRERRFVIPKGKLNHVVIDALESAPLVRSLRREGVWILDELSIDLRSQRLLRVSANANNMLLKKDGRCFPAANINHVNLRYLAFSCRKPATTRQFTERPYIPSSISLFWNMQTLIIVNCDAQISAPYEIWEMPQLRHLEVDRVCLPDPFPGDRPIQQEPIVLENLHTLVGVENLRLTEEVCKRMPNIKELSVFYDRFHGDCEASSYYCPHNLGRFSKLESLKCEFGDDSMFPDDFKWRDVVLNFTFPTSLEELCLWNTNIHWEDLTEMIKSLPHLGLLKLNLVQGALWGLDEEDEEGLPRLKVLWISRCDDLTYWNANSSHFPVLEILRIWTMPNLSEIPYDIGEIPTLRLIELYHCSVPAAVSAMRIVVEQESYGNQDLRLEVYFCKMEEVESFLKIVEEEGLTSNSLRLHLP